MVMRIWTVSRWILFFPSRTPAQFHGATGSDALSVIPFSHLFASVLRGVHDMPAKVVIHGLRPDGTGAKLRCTLFAFIIRWRCKLGSFLLNAVHIPGCIISSEK